MRPQNYFNKRYQRRWYIQVINLGLVCVMLGLLYVPLLLVGFVLLFSGGNSHYHDSKKRLTTAVIIALLPLVILFQGCASLFEDSGTYKMENIEIPEYVRELLLDQNGIMMGGVTIRDYPLDVSINVLILSKDGEVLEDCDEIFHADSHSERTPLNIYYGFSRKPLKSDMDEQTDQLNEGEVEIFLSISGNRRGTGARRHITPPSPKQKLNLRNNSFEKNSTQPIGVNIPIARLLVEETETTTIAPLTSQTKSEKNVESQNRNTDIMIADVMECVNINDYGDVILRIALAPEHPWISILEKDFAAAKNKEARQVLKEVIRIRKKILPKAGMRKSDVEANFGQPVKEESFTLGNLVQNENLAKVLVEKRYKLTENIELLVLYRNGKVVDSKFHDQRVIPWTPVNMPPISRMTLDNATNRKKIIDSYHHLESRYSRCP